MDLPKFFLFGVAIFSFVHTGGGRGHQVLCGADDPGGRERNAVQNGVFMCVRLAFWEEKIAQAEFGPEYERCAALMPRFFPKHGRVAQEHVA